MGYYSFNVTSDPSKEYYMEVSSQTPTSVLGTTDTKKIGNYALKSLTLDGLSYQVYDLNNDNKITVSDKFLLWKKRNGAISTFGTLPISMIYTSTEYSSIKAASTNVRSTYSGVSTYKSTKLTSGGTLNLYIISTGFYNSVSF